MESIDDVVATLTTRPDTSAIRCDREAGAHQCVLYGCPKDDPDWVHICFAQDCDFTEAEYQKWRMGLLSFEQFHRIGARRAEERKKNMLRFPQDFIIEPGAPKPTFIWTDEGFKRA